MAQPQLTGTDLTDQDRKINRQVLRGLRNWPKDSLGLVQEAVEAGCRLRRTGGNHVMITAPNGQQALVSRGGEQRGSATFNDNKRLVYRMLAEQPGHEPEKEEVVTEPRPLDAETLRKAAADQLAQFQCKLCRPPRQLLNQEALDAHNRDTHVQCPECKDWLRNSYAKGPHNSIKHMGHKPWESRKTWLTNDQKAAKKAAEEKGEKPDLPDPVDHFPRRSHPEVGRWFCANPTHKGRECETNGATTHRKNRDEGTAGHDWEWRGYGPAPTQSRLSRPIRQGPPKNGNGDIRLPDRAPIDRHVETRELPEPSTQDVAVAVGQDGAATTANAAIAKLMKIQAILGVDPRLAELEKQVRDLKADNEELRARLELMRAGIRQAQEAADI